MDAETFERHVTYVIRAHAGQFRSHDKKTTYGMHPTWCSTTMLSETTLPEETRYTGALALLYHDVDEETKAGLPEDLPPRVKHLVGEMTFPEGSIQEQREIWGKDPEVRLLKLYDRVSNLMDSSWMAPDQFVRHNNYAKRLVADVEKNYGSRLNIIKLAKAIIKW